jgi:hypothetical protein
MLSCSGVAIEDGVIWYRKMTNSISSASNLLLRVVQDLMNDVDHVAFDNRKRIAMFTVSIGLMLFGMFPIIVTSALGTTSSLRIYARTMERRSREIKREKRKTERLVNEMLPKSVAYRLRKGEQVSSLAESQMIVGVKCGFNHWCMS